MKREKYTVVGSAGLVEARRLAEEGKVAEASATVADFCWHNPTLQAEGGEVWGDLMLAAKRLQALKTAAEARPIFAEMVKRSFPKLAEAKRA